MSESEKSVDIDKVNINDIKKLSKKFADLNTKNFDENMTIKEKGKGE